MSYHDSDELALPNDVPRHAEPWLIGDWTNQVIALRVLGLVSWAAGFGALLAVLALIWKPRGFYLRFIQWIAQMLCCIMLVAIWTISEDATWWQNLSFDLGIMSVVTLTIVKRRRATPRTEPPEAPTRSVRWLFDYLIGCCVYLMMIWAIDSATSLEPKHQGAMVVLGTLLGFVLVSQMTTAAALRVLNAAIANDYRMDRRRHYVLATIPLLAALAIVIARQGSPLSLIFSLGVVAIGWRFTENRPHEFIKIVRDVAARLRATLIGLRTKPRR